MTTLRHAAVTTLITRLASQTKARPRVVISSCLAGQAVRYDATDKKLDSAYPALSQHLELLNFCPEMAAGMGTPREPIQRVIDHSGLMTLRLANDSNTYLGDGVAEAAHHWLQHHEVVAAVLKARSPSCGSGNTPIYNGDGDVVAIGDGVFTQALKEQQSVCVVDEAFFTEPPDCSWFVLGCYLQSLQRCNDGIHSLWADNLASFLMVPASERDDYLSRFFSDQP